MKTLKELFDEHGSVWMAFKDTPNVMEFKPIGYTEDKLRIIVENMPEELHLVADVKSPYSTGYVLYTPPKKTVRKYLWAGYIKYGNHIVSASESLYNLFLTDEQASKLTDFKPIKRFDGLFVDVEE